MDVCGGGYYCPGGDSFQELTCPVGHRCVNGSAAPQPCPAGTYQDAILQVDCKDCPTGFYCETASANPLPCPPGYFCPMKTTHATQNPCPEGTFSNRTHLTSWTECDLCLPGKYCAGSGLTSATGECGPGHYCTRGAITPLPDDETSGYFCEEGFVCQSGSFTPRPSHTWGYICPPGSTCQEGAVHEIGCPPGQFNPTFGQFECLECPEGNYCPGNSSWPVTCPIYHYCTAGIHEPIECPHGTHGVNEGLTNSDQCALCPAGQYCVDGSIAGPCSPGHFCVARMPQPNPSNDFLPLGGLCPPGHYCETGTHTPVPCPNGTVYKDEGAQSVLACGLCEAGFLCFEGDPVPRPCPKGAYCPFKSSMQLCPIGTYNPHFNGENETACLPCPSGYFCKDLGISNYTTYPCPIGKFCLINTLVPIDCPEATFRDTMGASSLSDCHICTGGNYCLKGSMSPIPCNPGDYLNIIFPLI